MNKSKNIASVAVLVCLLVTTMMSDCAFALSTQPGTTQRATHEGMYSSAQRLLGEATDSQGNLYLPMSNEQFIQAQIGKLEAIYSKNRISWGKIEQTDANKQTVFASISDVRNVLSELLQAVDSNPSLATEKGKILQAIELVFNKQGINLRKDLKFYPIHPLQAALSFIQELGITDPAFILSAILHDVIEDVEQFTANPSLIGEMFGANVQANVESVTNQELPPQTKEWLQSKGVSEDAMKVVEYQLGVAREITHSPVTLLLKSVDFSDNALKLRNLSGNLQLQARLAAKYGALIRVFAEEFLRYANQEAAKGTTANSALVAGLRRKADVYQAAEQEVTGWARSWNSFEQLNAAMHTIGDSVEIASGASEDSDLFASWSKILKEALRTHLAAEGVREASGALIDTRRMDELQNGHSDLFTIIDKFTAPVPYANPGHVVTMEQAELENLYTSLYLSPRERIEIFVHKGIGLSDVIKKKVDKINLKFKETHAGAQDIIICRPPFEDEEHLAKLLAKSTEPGIKRIVVTAEGLCDANKLITIAGSFNGARLLNIALPENYAGMDTDDKTFYQSWTLNVAILGRMLEQDSSIRLRIALANMLKGSIEGDINTFIDNLVKNESGWASPAQRIGYFLGEMVHLSRKIAEDYDLLKLRMKAFWTAA